MAGKALVATVVWYIRSLGLQRKLPNWFVQFTGLIFVPRLNVFPGTNGISHQVGSFSWALRS